VSEFNSGPIDHHMMGGDVYRGFLFNLITQISFQYHSATWNTSISFYSY